MYIEDSWYNGYGERVFSVSMDELDARLYSEFQERLYGLPMFLHRAFNTDKYKALIKSQQEAAAAAAKEQGLAEGLKEGRESAGAKDVANNYYRNAKNRVKKAWGEGGMKKGWKANWRGRGALIGGGVAAAGLAGGGIYAATHRNKK